jgi:gliding motility-associated-like protein
VSIDLVLDPINPGCEPFDVNGTISASGFTYWDPLEGGVAPFVLDGNTEITVCFDANHTYVSDLGFVLIGPPGCGSPAVTLSPNPQVINNANGCCCNSGNNLNNLCFSTSNANQLNMCGSGTPLGGTYGFYNGTFPGFGGASYPQGGVGALNGCNAAEGGWAIQIYDCIGADVGALTGASIVFNNGSSQIVYDSGPINSAINDNSCTPATASIYVVPLTTPINPDPNQIPNSGTLTYTLGVNGAPVSLNQGTNNFTQTVNPIPTFDEWYFLEIEDELGCTAIDSAFFDFTGYADATVTDPIPNYPNNSFCVNDPTEQLEASDPGGIWTGIGVSATGLFDPATAGLGNHDVTYTIPPPCGDIDVINITVFDFPDATINPLNALNELCENDAPVQVTTVAPGGALSGLGVDPTGMFDPANAGEGVHTITYEFLGNCPASSIMDITVLYVNDATIAPVSTFCVNDPSEQLAAGDPGGTWTGTGVSATGLFDPAIAGLGNHAITYTIPPPCGDVDIINITVFDLPDATINPLNELCADEPPVQITTVALGGVFSGPGVGPTGIFDPAIAGEGIQTITYEFLGNCPASSTMDITVLHVNDATINPINATNIICIDGAPVQLTSVDPGGTWSGTGISATGLFTPTTAGTGVHTITCDIADPCGDNQTMDIEVIEVTFTNATTDALCFNELSGQISIANATGSAPHLFSIDGGTATQATGQFLDLLAGNYNLIVTDDNGCSSQPVAVVVNQPTELTVGAVMDQQSNCDQPDGQATALAAGGTVGLGYTYQWSSIPVQNSATAVGLTPQGYDVVTTDDNGCTATTALIITSTPPITVDIIAISDPLCKGACDGTAAAIASPNAVLGAGETWSWNSATLNNTANATNLCGDNWYTVTYTDAVGCVATADTVLAEPTLVVLDLSLDTNLICIGGTDSLWVSATGGSVGGFTYSWSSFPLDPAININGQNQEAAPVDNTTYSVFATDNNGCVSSVELIDINVHPPLELSIIRPITSDSSICPYDFATLDLLPSGGNGNYTVYLMPDSVNPVTLPILVQPANDSTFTFVLVDDCENLDVEASITINLKVMPQIDFKAEDTVGCQPFYVEFEDLTTPDPGAVFWNFGDLDSDIGQPTGGAISYTYPDEGAYDVTVTAVTNEGCVDSITKPEYILVNPLPEAYYKADPSYVNLFNARVKFVDLSSDIINVWNWSFGDGDESSIQHPNHIYSDTGLFNVILEVENNFGCLDSVSSKIEIYPDYTMYIPNSFTPNKDGINDVFKPMGDGFFQRTYSFKIFDRWGEEIFYTANYEIGWDGTFKGAPVESSSFTYQVKAIDLNYFNREHFGYVILTR